jgi:hypothetical protein
MIAETSKEKTMANPDAEPTFRTNSTGRRAGDPKSDCSAGGQDTQKVPNA